jgi:TrmH family RNA methyltransferase
VVIGSRSNAKAKLVRTLSGRSRERREAGAFLAEGVRLIEEALTSDWPFRFVLYGGELSDRGRRLVMELRGRGVEADEVAAGLLSSLGETATSQGLLAVLARSANSRSC